MYIYKYIYIYSIYIYIYTLWTPLGQINGKENPIYKYDFPFLNSQKTLQNEFGGFPSLKKWLIAED